MKLSEATVLIVDDELELLEIFSSWLDRCGCKVFTAANGAEALEILMRETVDALVSDIRMPIMDGVTLLHRVHELDLIVPSVIFVSGFGDVERREMHGLGVETLIEKPLRRQHLVQALEMSLKDRTELWQTPVKETVTQVVSIEVKQEQHEGGCGFRLGRGGCSFPSGQRLAEDATIELVVAFADGRTLRAQGEVEWFKEDCLCAGIAFRYLDPGCREWVIGAIDYRKLKSFIPPCTTGVRGAGSFQPSVLPGLPLERAT